MLFVISALENTRVVAYFGILGLFILLFISAVAKKISCIIVGGARDMGEPRIWVSTVKIRGP